MAMISGRFKKGLVLSLLLCGMVVGLFPNQFLQAEIGAVRLYQVVGSPVAALVVRCRYHPSCSHYGLQVLEQDGLLWGNLKIAERLFLCSPVGYMVEQISGKKLYQVNPKLEIPNPN